MTSWIKNAAQSFLFGGLLLMAGGCGSSEDGAEKAPGKAPAAAPAPLEPVKKPATPKELSATSSPADFLEKGIVDEFNPDVSAAERGRGKPQAGGKFRIRNPANLAHLNSITTVGQPERVVVNHMSDSLVDQDPETLEYFPEMASWWREADLVKRKDGEVREGRIIERTPEYIVFVPGAWKITRNRFDLESVDAAKGSVTLKEAAGGGAQVGSITEFANTVRIDESTNPDLAESAEKIVLSDLDVYTVQIGSRSEERPYAKENCAFEFFIRPGVTWHDGKPFTAEDVLFSFETVMNPAVEAQTYRAYLQDVTACTITQDGAAVKFHYARPYFQALSFIGGINGNTWFIPRHVFNQAEYGGDARAFGEAFNNHPFKDNPVYTGPYRFKSWDRGNSLVIERHADYWKNKMPEGANPFWTVGRPWLQELEWVLYTESAAVLRDLQNGNLDADFDVEPSTWAMTETRTAPFLDQMIRAERIGFLYTYVGWNLNNPIFQDVRVRRALAMLIPRDSIGKDVLQGVAFPVSGPFYCNGPAVDPSVPSIGYDPEAARALLTQAGWLDRDGDGVLEKEIDGKMVPFAFTYHIHNARDYHQKIADIIKESVEQARIKVTIVKSDWSIFADTVRDKKFDAVRYAWGNTLEPDPFQIWHSSQIENKGNNFISYSNSRIDELCLLIRETFDPIQRWTYAREFHRILADEQPVCFLDGFLETYFIHRKIRGVKLLPSSYPHDFTEWSWSEIPANRR